MPLHPRAKIRIALLSTALVAAVAVLSCEPARRAAIQVFDSGYESQAGPLEPTFEGPDAQRPQVAVGLQVVAEGLPQITGIQAIPGHPDEVVILQKEGAASRLNLSTGALTPWFQVSVVTASEQGLLGLAFAPDFEQSGRFYLNLTPTALGGHTRIARWQTDPQSLQGPARVNVVLEVEQPYQNHNAGQLAFGPDGMLYVGMGDGGFRADPLNAGQDGQRLLGKMLRLDVRGEEGFRIPADNPFRGDPSVRDEVYALGLRNPWRYSFSPDGRLIVADVGQDKWEEINIVTAGANLGWKHREGYACFDPPTGCLSEGLTDPIYVYGHDEGKSISGGYVLTGDAIPALKGMYVFGDFVTGRLWAFALPESPGQRVEEVHALGRWPILPATFGLDAKGDLLIGDYGGRVLRMGAPGPG